MLIDVAISTKDNVVGKNFSLYYVICSILSQDIDHINLVVADNGSADGTTQKLRDTFGQKIGVLDTSHCRGNIAASRNAAIACGTGNIVFLLDDDTILDGYSCLKKAIEIVKNVDFSCGARRLWAPISWPKLIRMDDPINKVVSTLHHISSEPTSINRISGKNILDNRSYIGNFGAIKRSIFHEIGGFDEQYVGWGYQDTDLMRRLCVGGYRYEIFSNHDINVFHLSHMVNKGEQYEVNRQRFLEKQRKDGRSFKTNHFFEIYENDGYSLFSDFPKDNID